MSKPKIRTGAWALWIGVSLMFLLVITAWTTVIRIAAENPTQTIQIAPNTDGE